MNNNFDEDIKEIRKNMDDIKLSITQLTNIFDRILRKVYDISKQQKLDE